MPDLTNDTFDLPTLQHATEGVDAEAAGRELDEQIRKFMSEHTPTDEHMRKRVTI
jgi:RNA 3'-terminal phosphate cyclase